MESTLDKMKLFFEQGELAKRAAASLRDGRRIGLLVLGS